MSGLGILATALAGGAGVIAKQAGDDVEAQRKSDLMRQQADIEEQMRMRLADFSERLRQQGVLAENTGPIADARLAVKQRELTMQTDAEIGKAKALATADEEVAKRRAGDKSYLASVRTLKLADPEVQARIQSSLASAGASAAQARTAAEQLKQLQQVGSMADQVRGLQKQLAAAKSPEERETIQRQITDLGFSGKDTKGFMSIAERAMSNADAALKVLNDPAAADDAKRAAMTQLQRANQFADQAAAQAGIKIAEAGGKAGPAVGAEVGGYVFKGGDPNDRKNWTPKTAVSAAPQTGGPMLKSIAADDITRYRPVSDGSGRMVDVSTGRTLSPEQSAVVEKIRRGETTSPRERALLQD